METKISNMMFINNTHIATQRTLFCSNQRPCNRLQKCKFCFTRYRKFLTSQMNSIARDWKLFQLVTLVVEVPAEHAQNKLLQLIKLRPKVHRTLRKFGKYISVAAVHGMTGTRAHFHIIMPKVDYHKLKTAFASWLLYEHNLNVTPIFGNTIGHHKRTLCYLIHNLRETLIVKPRNKRLLTASRGFYSGRPKNISKFEGLV